MKIMRDGQSTEVNLEPISDGLRLAVEILVQGILEYESDTWSSSEMQVDRARAEEMAAFLIYQHLFDADKRPSDSLDGAEIGLAYDVCVEEAEGQ